MVVGGGSLYIIIIKKVMYIYKYKYIFFFIYIYIYKVEHNSNYNRVPGPASGGGIK